ncbi:2-methoxy-6-polyprenyl-1 [Diplonema papillatum]|nr:2-methoxy-6-polyprenyl-1 [Diplonema papillatum]
MKRFLSVSKGACSFGRLASSATQERGSDDATPKTSTTHFGFRTVPEEEKQGMVNTLFGKVSGNYDLMNDAMSAGIHRCWKDHTIKRLDPELGKKYLDVAGGTGDVAFRILDRLQDLTMEVPPLSNQQGGITIADINPKMLEQGEIRYLDRKRKNSAVPVEFVEANAEELPFEDNTFDAYTIAFGIRNVTHTPKALSEAYRVLKKGGRLLVLEFSRVENDTLRSVYDAYSFNVIPVLGHVLAGDWNSYQYLVESIRKFPPQEEFADMIRTAGFKGVSYESLTFGVCALHSGWKL